MQYTTLIAALAFGSTALGHMEMSFPAPLRGKTNPNVVAKTDDTSSMTSPLKDASQFPCKGFLTDLVDINGAGKPTATFTQGGDGNFTIIGGAAHGGGSCQAALSYDQGKTFNVIHSFIGSCPLATGDSFPFKIPSDAKEGNAVFAWTWFNKIGNREMYMNCASVNIAKGSGDKPAVAFDKRPALFVANIATNDCTTIEQTDVEFPDPGPDVTTKQAKKNDKASLAGSCGASGSPPAPSTGGSSPSAAPSPAQSAVPSSSPSQNAPQASAPVSAPSSVPANGSMSATKNGECGGQQTCTGSTFGKCCSKFGYCGTTTTHCGDECQGAFGVCGGPAKMIRGGSYATARSASPRSVEIVPVFQSPNPVKSVSQDGTCGGSTTCKDSKWGSCCSKYNYCGVTADHCMSSSGCQTLFGTCL